MKKYYVTYLFLIVITLPIVLELFEKISGVQDKNESSGVPSFSLEAGEAVKANTCLGFVANLHVDLSNYRKKLDKHYRFKNVLRPVLMKPYNLLKSDVFNINPIPEKVITGIDGWMFLGENNSNVISETIGLLTFSEPELKTREEYYLTKKKWFKENNINYFMVIAPNKHSVYREYLPINKIDNKTKFEQLKATFKATNFKLIDLADYYDEHKNEKLFYKTDSHWNNMGAFLAYQKTMDELKQYLPELNSLKLEDFNVELVTTSKGDLASMLDVKIKEENKVLSLKNPTAIEIINNKINHSKYIYSELRYKSSANKLKVVVFGDSYSAGLVKYLKESFGVSVFYANLDFDYELILKEKPDLVIQELAERGL